MAHDDDNPAGFLSRWSRRKVDERAGRPTEEPKPAATLPTARNPSPPAPSPALENPPAKPAPTLADAQQLTTESDFTGFMARGVAPDVKNAAMKKLFADPHFNVMDGLDIYIDDYGIPDPLPLAMLRQMTSAKTLNLFDDEPADVEPKVVAQSVLTENTSNPEPTTHDHADLRLQPDPTPGPEGTEPKPV